MAETKARRLAAALDEFISSSPDVEAAAVVSFDGLPMASALPDTMEEDRVGAMSAALLSLGEQAALGLGRGQLNQVFVEGQHGYVFLMSARDQAVLAAVARHSAKIGFMLFEMRRAAERIGEVLLSTDHGEHRAAQDEPSWIDDPQWSAPAEEPVRRHDAPEPAPDVQQDVHHAEPASREVAAHPDEDAGHQEPAPWSSQIPREHDLSSEFRDGDPSGGQHAGNEDFSTYRDDEDRTAAPWQ